MSRTFVAATRGGVIAFVLAGSGLAGAPAVFAQSTPVPDQGDVCASILAGTPVAGHPGGMFGDMGQGPGMQADGTPRMGMGMGMGSHAGTPGAGMAGQMGRIDPQMADLSFLTMMPQHHQGAIEMARIALPRLERPELRDLAQRIISDQEAEIGEMDQFRSSMGQGTPTAGMGDMAAMMTMMLQAMPGAMQGTDMPGMSGGMAGPYFERLCTSETPDLEFIDQMIPHHAAATAMARAVIANGAFLEVRALAERMVDTQSIEIEQMRAWRDAWSMAATPTP